MSKLNYKRIKESLYQPVPAKLLRVNGVILAIIMLFLACVIVMVWYFRAKGISATQVVDYILK